MNSYGDILKGAQTPLINGGAAPGTTQMEVRRYGNQVSIIPHVRTFNSISQWMSRTYRFRFDEALQRNYNSAKAMRNDAFIQGLYRKRMTPVTKSDFSIESEGPDASEEVNAFYKSLLEQTPQWHEFRRNVAECVWFGRYGVQMAFDELTYEGRKFEWKGNKAIGISHWLPHLGDKITFTFDFFPCIRVSPIYMSTWKAKGATVLQPGDPRIVPEAISYRWSEEGPVVVLDNPEIRKDFVISIFEIQDAPWDEPTMAGGIRGVGLRHYTFWNWDNKQEIVGWAMNYLEEFGAGGYTVVGYDGPEGLKRQQEAFADPMQKIIYVPIIPGTDEKVTDSVTRLEPATTGNDAIMKWAKEYFGADLEVLFLGHPANAKAVSTGLGSSVADRAADDLKLINRSDAEIIDTAMSHEVLPRLKQFNHPNGRYTLKFVSTIRGIDKQSGMQGADTLYKWGGKIPKQFAYMLADVPMLKPDEEFLQDPAHAQAEMQMQAQQVALGGGADTSYMERGNQHLEAVDAIFSGGNEATLESARKALWEQGVPEEDVLGTLAAAVASGKIEEHDVDGGVHYTKPGKDAVDGEGKRIDPDYKPKAVSYSVETDPSLKWTEETGPISGKPRWRNNETGRIQYRQPGTGRHVQASDRSEKNGVGFKLDQGKYGVGVGLLPGKGLATGVVEDRVLQLAKEGGKSLQGEGVLAEVMHVDKRLMKAQAISLAAKLGLQIDSKTSKTQALAHIENVLRSKQQEAKGQTPGVEKTPAGKTLAAGKAPGKAGSRNGGPAPLLAMAEKGDDSPDKLVGPGGNAPDSASGHVTALNTPAPVSNVPARDIPQETGAGIETPGSPTAESEAVPADSPDSTVDTVDEAPVGMMGSDDPLSAGTVQAPSVPKLNVPVKSTVEQVRDYAKDKYAEAKNQVQEHNAAIRSAIGALRSHDDPAANNGLFTKTGKLRRDRLSEADYNAIPGFDVVASEMAGMFPGIFNPNGGYGGDINSTVASGENSEKLMTMLREGEKPAPKLSDYENQAFQEWYDSHPGQGDAAEPESWQDVSFDPNEFGGSDESGAIQGDTGEQRDGEGLADPGESQVPGTAGAWGDSSYPSPIDEAAGVRTEADRSGDSGGMEGGNDSQQITDTSTGVGADYHPSGVNPNAPQGTEAGLALSQAEVPQDAMPVGSGGGGDHSTDAAEVPAPGGSERGAREAGFMEQTPAGKYSADDLEELAGQSFTNDQGLSIDVTKDEDGTWSVGKRYGLSAQGAANYLNELKAEKAQGLFSSEVTAQAPVEKKAEKWEWAKPTTKQEAGELPGMKDTFAPGMFAAGSPQREVGKSAEEVLSKATRKAPWGGEADDPIASDILRNKDAKSLLGNIPVVHGVLGSGASSIVLDSGDGNAHRIGPISERPASKHVLQALQTNKAGGWQHEVLPKVETSGITENHVEQMKGMLKEDGLDFHDAGTDNLGMTNDGRLVVTDPGSVRKMDRGHVAATDPKPTGTQRAIDTLKAGMAALKGGKTNEQGSGTQQERGARSQSPNITPTAVEQSPTIDEGGTVAGVEGTAKAQAESKEGQREKFTIEKFEGTQIGYKGPLDRGKNARKLKGYLITDSSGYQRHFDTKREALKFIEEYGGEVG